MAGEGSLGVTALLDELLSNESGDDGGAQPPLNFAPLDRVGDDEVTRQVKDLHNEMDDCLASLDVWARERKIQSDALQKELEAQYGFSYQEAMAFEAGDIGIHGDGLGDTDEAAELNPYDSRIPHAPFVGIADRSRTSGVTVEASSSALVVDDATRQTDEIRIAKLRAEVEELRHRGDAVEATVPEPEGSPRLHPGELSGVSGLTDWCAEVDAALGLPPSPLANNVAGGDGLDAIESKLADAKMRGTEMDGELCSAKARIDAELNDLETLLSECTAIQEKLAVGHC